MLFPTLGSVNAHYHCKDSQKSCSEESCLTVYLNATQTYWLETPFFVLTMSANISENPLWKMLIHL